MLREPGISGMSPGRRRRGLLFLVVPLVAAGGVLLATLGLRGRKPPPSVFAVLARSGLSAALDSLERQAGADSLVLRSGHQLAHALGREAMMSNGGDPAVLGECSPVFASGCYHGVVEALLKLRGRVDMGELQHMCAAAGSEGARGPVHECVHGLGHGVLGAVGLDIDATLRHCDSLAGTGFVVACREGAFMEAISTALVGQGDHPGHAHGSHEAPQGGALSIDPVDPYSPCDRYGDPYGESCWLFQGFVILRKVDFDAASALRLCEVAPGGRADRCYESVGHQLAGLFQRSDAWVVEQCGKGDAKRAPRCAAGAALAFASMDWTGERVRRYCESVPEAWRGSCLAAAAETLALVS
jgi:hypothetical protein